jgi:hypothetical protein
MMALKLYHEEGLRGFVFEKRIYRCGVFSLQEGRHWWIRHGRLVPIHAIDHDAP